MDTDEKYKMLDLIYEVIADKSWEDGCIFKNKDGFWFTYYEEDKDNIPSNITILGHRVLMGDILGWIEDNYDYILQNKRSSYSEEDRKFIKSDLYETIVQKWKWRREGIERNEEALVFIYNLISIGKKK